jgi:hypothetical protein
MGGALRRGDEGALDMAGVEVNDDISSVIRIEENVERGGIWGALGSNADRIYRMIEDRLCMLLWMT